MESARERADARWGTWGDNKLRDLMRRAHCSREEVAGVLTCDLATVERYEEGAPIPEAHAVILGELFDIGPDWVRRGRRIMEETLIEVGLVDRVLVERRRAK